MNNNTVFAVNSLGNILSLIENIPALDDGEYALYIPKSDMETFNSNTLCAVILVLFEDEAGYVPKFAKERNLDVICDAWLAKDVAKHVREQLIEVNDDDLVKALKFFLDNDSFLDWGKDKKQ